MNADENGNPKIFKRSDGSSGSSFEGRAENAEQMVSRLLEVGSALEAQAYDAWIKDGMLDFPAAKDWELLINEIKETKKESEK